MHPLLGDLDILHPLVESQAHTLWEIKVQVRPKTHRRSQVISLHVEFGEMSQRTELLFSRASLRGPGLCAVARGKAFSAESLGLIPTSSLKGGLGIWYLLVLSVSCGVHIFSLPYEREFSGQGRGGHSPRCPFALSRDTRVFFSLDHYPPSSSLNREITQPAQDTNKGEERLGVGALDGSSPACPPAPKPV